MGVLRPVHTRQQIVNCCRKRQQIIARNSNIVAAPVKVAVSGNNLLPFSVTNLPFPATIVAVFGNFVAWCGQVFRSIAIRK